MSHASRPASGPSGPLFRPLAGNPLRTRGDLERALRVLVDPLLASLSSGGARVRLGHAAVLFPDAAEELEGFARPLWGLVPLALGGGRFEHWELWRRGLASGSDPAHPEYWGAAGRDQRMVEMAAVGFGLAFAPGELWDPLPEPARARLVDWLARIDEHLPVESNWQFFRVLVNLGLERVGRFDPARWGGAQRDSLARIDSYADADGWYRDGPQGHVDWYVPWALHTYGLVYAAAAARGTGDPEVGARFRERARRFARHHRHWFDARGRALPFGRSLTYRFAQAAFWSALVLADEEALPWGCVKGLLLRHLRSWAEAPIATRDGLLAPGYAYPQPALLEPYSSSGSPYWALKAFLCLAAPEDHPFWRAAEEPFSRCIDPDGARGPVVQVPARWVISRDAAQALAVCAGQTERLYPNGPAKYAKLAYSSAFGFSVAVPETRPHQNVHDSMLALRGDDGPWQVRDEILAWGLEGECVWSRWRPFPDVEVVSVLAGRCPWHWRLHRVTRRSGGQALHSCDAGFALGFPGLEPGLPGLEVVTRDDAVALRSDRGTSAVFAMEAVAGGGRAARMQIAPPGTSVMVPRSAVPALFGSHPAEGRRAATWELRTAVLATEDPGAALPDAAPAPPADLDAVLRRALGVG